MAARRATRIVLTHAARLLAGLVALGLLISVIPVAVLRWIDPPVTAFMILQPGAVTDLSYEWRDREEISRNLAWAVISAEDQKFFQHHGFDFASIREAVDEYRSGDELRGASTITQQVAKNIFLWPGQSLLRKGIEAYLTILIEVCWPKARILEVYLNVAEFGDGIFGAEAAAQRVFGTSAASLSRAQAALLAAVLPSPKRYRAYSPTPYVRGRQLWILGQMSRVRAGANTASSGWPFP